MDIRLHFLFIDALDVCGNLFKAVLYSKALAIDDKTFVIRMVNSVTFLARLPSESQDHEPESAAGDRTVRRQGKSKRPGLH